MKIYDNIVIAIKRWRFRRKTRKIVLKQYDFILIQARKQMKSKKINRFPIVSLYFIVDRCYFPTEHDSPTLVEISTRFNQSLDNFKKWTKDQAKTQGDGKISFAEMRAFIDHERSAFIRGSKQKKKADE